MIMISIAVGLILGIIYFQIGKLISFKIFYSQNQKKGSLFLMVTVGYLFRFVSVFTAAVFFNSHYTRKDLCVMLFCFVLMYLVSQLIEIAKIVTLSNIRERINFLILESAQK